MGFHFRLTVDMDFGSCHHPIRHAIGRLPYIHMPSSDDADSVGKPESFHLPFRHVARNRVADTANIHDGFNVRRPFMDDGRDDALSTFADRLPEPAILKDAGAGGHAYAGEGMMPKETQSNESDIEADAAEPSGNADDDTDRRPADCMFEDMPSYGFLDGKHDLVVRVNGNADACIEAAKRMLGELPSRSRAVVITANVEDYADFADNARVLVRSRDDFQNVMNMLTDYAVACRDGSAGDDAIAPFIVMLDGSFDEPKPFGELSSFGSDSPVRIWKLIAIDGNAINDNIVASHLIGRHATVLADLL